MAAPDKDTSALFLSGSIVLIAALSGYLWYQAPLKSARPSNPGLERHEAVVARRALARLWQDPLAAVDEHRKTLGGKSEAADKQGWRTLADEVAAQLEPGSAVPNTSVLLVMTDGSPYVEGTEQRIRDRYAVGSALSVACYVPEDGDRVGYVMSEHDPPIPLPFEWYGPRALRDCAPGEPTATLYEHVLVVWLSDELFRESPPLQTLAGLMRTLQTLTDQRFRARNPTANDTPPLASGLIGPSGSSLLRAMVEEGAATREPIRWPGTPQGFPQGTLPVYSPSATVSADVIAQSIQGLQAGSTLDTETWMRDSLRKGGVILPYRIPSDFALSQALIQELALRGVRQDSHIALIAEWDSYYGRTLPSEFLAAACVAAKGSSSDGPCRSHGEALEALANPEAQPRLAPWIRQYTYLRGLDGELPGAETGGGKTAKTKPFSGKSEDRALGDLERPEGESQLDYVRRLANRLEADSEDRDFRAIGILGSDVYDKLLILQALRKRFPHALFFTTDLDARLLHPSQYEWTHNLIIASHFDLQVHPSLQQSIPPFRSSYQSSTFLAVLQAIGHLRRGEADGSYTILGAPSRVFRPQIAPLVYELGRTAPVRFPTEEIPTMSTRPPSGQAAGEDVNSPASADSDAIALRSRRLHFLLVALAALCGLYLIIPVIRSIPEEMLSVEIGRFVIRTALALTLCLGLSVACFHWLGTRPGGEPFYWAEGVSLWPSELVRLTAALLAISFLRFATQLLARNEGELTGAYRLHDAGAPPPLRPRFSSWTKFFSPTAWSIDFTSRAEHLPLLWHEHGAFARTTWQRVVPQTVMLGLLGLVLLYAFGLPHAPARGNVALAAHGLAWGFSSSLTGLLIFYVVDAIRVCTGFIHQFALEPTHWSPEVVQPMSEQRKLPADLVGEWLDIRFIADRTKVVSSLIHFPIVVLFLMILARHRIFDDWSYPPALLLIYGVSAGYILVCAVLLSMAAEKARRTAVARLRDHLYDLRGRAQEPGQGERCAHQIAQIDLMLHDIQGIQQGAFAHWTQHPVFQALLLPSGGLSILALLDYFLTQ